MQTDENAVIRYLMKEMDPSEEVLMERAMMKDDDLLIEVESMRQTLQRLDDLPDKEPPTDLSESIIQQAADHNKQTSRWPTIPTEVYKYAAVLVIGMGIGSGLWMALDSSTVESEPSAEVGLTTGIQALSAENSGSESWIDREDVIYYQDMFNRQSSDFSDIMETSMKKLTPVDNNALQMSPDARGVQLTGSSN